MEQSEADICPICMNEYNEGDFYPRIFPCQQKHTYCTTCIKSWLDKPNNEITCPHDREKPALQARDLTSFPKNQVLLDIIVAHKSKTTRKCNDHNIEPDIVCLTCRTMVCHLCTSSGEKHEDHSYVMMEDFPDKFEKCSKKLREHYNEIQELLDENTVIIQNAEQIIQNSLETAFRSFVRKRTQEKEDLATEITEAFVMLSTDGIDDGRQTEEVVIQKLNETYQSLETIKALNNESFSNVEEKCKIILGEEVLNEILTDQWKKQSKKMKEHIKKKIDKVSQDFIKRIHTLFQERDLEDDWNLKKFSNAFKKPLDEFDELKEDDEFIHMPKKQKTKHEKKNSFGFPTEIYLPFKEEWKIDVSFTEDKGVTLEQSHSSSLNDDDIFEMHDHIQDSKADSIFDMFISNIVEANLSLSQITDGGLRKLKSTLQELVCMKQLTLRFDECLDISKTAFANLIPELSQLADIDLQFREYQGRDIEIKLLNRWNQINQKSLVTLIETVSLLSRLESLSLTFIDCPNLKNKGLDTILCLKPVAPSLTRIKVSFKECDDINDNLYKRIKTDTTAGLEGLDSLGLNFENCQNFTEKGEEKLRNYFKTRVDFDVRIKRK